MDCPPLFSVTGAVMDIKDRKMKRRNEFRELVFSVILLALLILASI
jgi:hypothetical protein